jgi:hypothetical protein
VKRLPAPCPTPASELRFVLAGLAGIVAFPLAGAALLGHLVQPLAFLALATSATVLFFGAMAKLDARG